MFDKVATTTTVPAEALNQLVGKTIQSVSINSDDYVSSDGIERQRYLSLNFNDGSKMFVELPYEPMTGSIPQITLQDNNKKNRYITTDLVLLNSEQNKSVKQLEDFIELLNN